MTKTSSCFKNISFLFSRQSRQVLTSYLSGIIMKVVTRFNPTSNGNLHLGHVFTMLVNEYFAHSVDGEFVLRIDDTSPPAADLPKERVQSIIQSQMNDIDWLKIP